MKKFFLVLIALGVIGGGIGYRMWNKPHENIEKATPDLKIDAVSLATAFETNEAEANTLYTGKLLQVTGTIAQIDKTDDGSVNILLETSNPISVVMCQLDKLATHNIESLDAGQKIVLKGKCSGYTTDVVMDRCIIL